MTKRNYTQVKELLPGILKMVEQGKTQREIAEHYGLKDKMVVKRLLERERRKERNQCKSRGRKPAKTLQEYKYENKRLKMEVALLRDFLWRTEGM